jgi:hypothetical protein
VVKIATFAKHQTVVCKFKRRISCKRRFTKKQKSKMTRQEYESKFKDLEQDKESYDRILKVYLKILPDLSKWTYSEVEWLTEHIKRTSAKASIISPWIGENKSI